MYLHLVQGLNQSDLPAYLLVEIHRLTTVRATFPIKFNAFIPKSRPGARRKELILIFSVVEKEKNLVNL